MSFRKKKQASSFFFSQFALSFNKIGCISEEKTSKLFFLLSICTIFANAKTRSDARVAEEARLESVYTPKAYREFESRSLRKNSVLHNSALFFYFQDSQNHQWLKRKKTGNNMLLPVCIHSCGGCHHPRFTLTPAITHSPGCFTAERS